MSKKIFSKINDFKAALGEGSYGINFKEFIDTLIDSGESFLMCFPEVDDGLTSSHYITVEDFVLNKYTTYDCSIVIALSSRHDLENFHFVFDKFSNQCGRLIQFPTTKELFKCENWIISSKSVKLYNIVKRINSKIKLIDNSTGITQWTVVSNNDQD